MRILAVLGEKSSGAELSSRLSALGYEVITVYDSSAALDEALSGIYDAAVVSASLSPKSGTELLRLLRTEGSSLHAVLLTAPHSAVRTDGLNAGADCCLSLPCDVKELDAQLRALLRRRCEQLLPSPAFGDLTLNLSTCTLLCGGEKARLSRTELELMRLLLQSGGRIISKETLLLKVWGYDAEVNAAIVETYISVLRRKLRAVGSHVTINALWRRGYYLELLPETGN